MELKVLRKELTARSTIGELHVDGKFECFTLEDAVRPVKIKGVTAIPAGAYEVVVNFSQRFQRPLPLLLNVPNFDGVRIHAGNTDADTEGCPLVGKTQGCRLHRRQPRRVRRLFPKIQRAAGAREDLHRDRPTGRCGAARALQGRGAPGRRDGR
jgi:hypothetical protein